MSPLPIKVSVALLVLGIGLFIAGVLLFSAGHESHLWSFLWWAVPFAGGTAVLVGGLRRAPTRVLRIVFALVLLPYALVVAVFVVILAGRLAL